MLADERINLLPSVSWNEAVLILTLDTLTKTKLLLGTCNGPLLMHNVVLKYVERAHLRAEPEVS